MEVVLPHVQLKHTVTVTAVHLVQLDVKHVLVLQLVNPVYLQISSILDFVSNHALMALLCRQLLLSNVSHALQIVKDALEHQQLAQVAQLVKFL